MKLIRIYIRLLLKYLKFYFSARTIYDLHSPFLVEFTTAVVEDQRHFYAFSFAEDIRERLKQDRTKVSIVELGAGSLVSSKKDRSIQDIVRHTAITPSTGRQLFRIINQFQPSTMLELGTSLGISTIYQAFGNYKAQMITVEGNPNLHPWSEQAFFLCDLKNIEQLEGSFAEKLPIALKKLKKLDYLFIDGDHRMDKTLAYFETCLDSLHNESIVIIADIHWSLDMERCWDKLKAHPKITLSIDLFNLGILFFREELKEKKDISLVRAIQKPWRLGFFLRKSW